MGLSMLPRDTNVLAGYPDPDGGRRNMYGGHSGGVCEEPHVSFTDSLPGTQASLR